MVLHTRRFHAEIIPADLLGARRGGPSPERMPHHQLPQDCKHQQAHDDDQPPVVLQHGEKGWPLLRAAAGPRGGRAGGVLGSGGWVPRRGVWDAQQLLAPVGVEAVVGGGRVYQERRHVGGQWGKGRGEVFSRRGGNYVGAPQRIEGKPFSTEK